MKAKELKEKYIKFFEKKGHKLIPSAPLVPENDASVLFTTAGMHPLVPYLLGESHPLGKRLVSVQKCLRTVDIDNVGDGFHHTFFEMLGNWSLGDYWKKEAIEWSWEFMTKELGLDPNKISVSCFGGDKDAPKDEEAAEVWRSLGIPPERINFLGKEENWWGPVGETGPCGPDTEMFYDTGEEKIEIWNDVFMQYNKTADGKIEPLKQKNVDTGMGVDRVTAITSGFGDDDYRTEQFWPIIEKIQAISDKNYDEYKKEMRIIADHLRAACFLIADGVEPSNKNQGYVLRRLIRRAIRYGKKLGITSEFTVDISKVILKSEKISIQLKQEEEKFSRTLDKGLKEIEKIAEINGKIAFNLYQTYGFPLELTMEIAAQKGQKIMPEEFQKEFKHHQELSRTTSAGMFKGGLGGQTEIYQKYHTATHLLHQALRLTLGAQVHQIGSNITEERARFDFTYGEKLTEEQKTKIENIINEKIKANLPVKMEIITLEEAKKDGALAFFGEKYGEKVKVYSIGTFSKEVCGGPHVDFTGVIEGVKITKEEAVGSGRRRIYLKLW